MRKIQTLSVSLSFRYRTFLFFHYFRFTALMTFQTSLRTPANSLTKRPGPALSIQRYIRVDFKTLVVLIFPIALMPILLRRVVIETRRLLLQVSL